jgi:hypothetical protein
MYWFWDVYVEAFRSWYHFRGLERFLDGVDLSRYEPFSPLEIRGPGGSPARAVGLGLRGDDLLIWLRTEGYTVQAAEAAWAEAGHPSVSGYIPPSIEGHMLTLPDLDAGEYTARWFDPQSGNWLAPVEVTVQGDRLVIPIPDFRRDLAARIVPNR